MAMTITEECINCAACQPECPNDAISEGKKVHEIDANKCTECKGTYDEPQCVAVCAVDCVVTSAAVAC
ncbi:Ferredoxin-2 [Georgfuchsia toluolica]|uniref:Ferredoxin-2 n=1 Tax=Georgfuchsia toluolica TaxID=424218 RepID=A0A916N909_9PROT|nr:YfhL family 4Fe-4S dicluster ferredoxin [Georgfuchsia toluolica]CAG4883917.1 Ferredoxin-2 [Georgfuchsia toluolica]